MRLPSNLGRSPVGFNMTPLIDVVFQLIIFFLVSSHLAKQEVQLELPLPTAVSGQEPVEVDVPRVTINVIAEDQLTLNGRTVAVGELRERLEAIRRDEGEDVEVRIRSARDVPYRQIEPILLACARAGVWNVKFAVYRAEETR